MSLRYDFPRAIEEDTRLARWVPASLHKLAIGVCPGVDVTLHPVLDGSRASAEDSLSANNANCGGYIVKVNVVQDERTRESSAAGRGGTDKYRRVGHSGVYDRLSTDCLRSVTNVQMQSKKKSQCKSDIYKINFRYFSYLIRRVETSRGQIESDLGSMSVFKRVQMLSFISPGSCLL